MTVIPGTTGARLGLKRGGIEIRQAFTYWPDLAQTLALPVLSVAVLLLLRGHHLSGTAFSLGSLTLPGLLGANIVVGALFGVSMQISPDREDGTLLRAKAIPSGMSAYVLGKVLLTGATTLVGAVVLLIVGPLAFPGVAVSAAGWLTLLWVLLLGLLACVCLGVTIGALLPRPDFVGLMLLPVAAITAISGIFYPITHLPGWLQATGQVFPMYWMGLGLRAALLPPAMRAVELNGQWRLPDVLLVLVLWSAAGLAAAPPVLRRMARKESGARVAARRERAMLRAT
ncbi:MAG TPA: ABC transporter permease [Trebonia sp.]|jgi:ABC-2 type transport system permease protein|nr:ABC transporter permease [Trebonia sp.]